MGLGDQVGSESTKSLPPLPWLLPTSRASWGPALCPGLGVQGRGTSQPVLHNQPGTLRVLPAWVEGTRDSLWSDKSPGRPRLGLLGSLVLLLSF